ncbi:unnamed protein product [Ilex paraguariensis]|uniref:Glycosyltransferase n=1 Tax=Ilex paraguariensis TaxID=185542 RepID=A0ABC8S624_9AQUA
MCRKKKEVLEGDGGVVEKGPISLEEKGNAHEEGAITRDKENDFVQVVHKHKGKKDFRQKSVGNERGVGNKFSVLAVNDENVLERGDGSHEAPLSVEEVGINNSQNEDPMLKRGNMWNCRGGGRKKVYTDEDDDYLTNGTLDTPIDWVTGLSNIRQRDLPSFIQTTNPNDIMFHFMRLETEDCLKAPAIIFNNFEELEREALQAVVSKFNFPNIYPIGPLSLLEQKYVPKSLSESLNSSFWKQDSKVFDWLESREPESVLYVNYGCVAVMSTQHFRELAWGLADSKQSFLWVIRPDVVKDGEAVLSEEFMEEIKDRGLLVSWCAQEKVLGLPAVGAFLTHCGWNSMTETVVGGVPVICWPFFADQQTNSRIACTKLAMGMEINPDVKRDEVSSLVREMMRGEEGKQMRINAKEWKRKAEIATDVGGSAYTNFDKLIKEVLLSEN